MKNTIILALSFLSIIAVNAQEERTIESYSRLKVSGAFVVTLDSRAKELSIKTENSKLIQYVKTEVVKGNLNIYVEERNRKLFRNEEVQIIVPYDKLDEIVLIGSGSVTSDQTIVTKNINVSVIGSGDIDVSLDAKNTDGSVEGSGDLKLKGKTQNFKAKVIGSGDLKAVGFISENAEIEVIGSGDAEVFVLENLNARVKGSGDIIYKGNPKTEDTRVSGSGSIEKK